MFQQGLISPTDIKDNRLRYLTETRSYQLVQWLALYTVGCLYKTSARSMTVSPENDTRTFFNRWAV